MSAPAGFVPFSGKGNKLVNSDSVVPSIPLGNRKARNEAAAPESTWSGRTVQWFKDRGTWIKNGATTFGNSVSRSANSCLSNKWAKIALIVLLAATILVALPYVLAPLGIAGQVLYLAASLITSFATAIAINKAYHGRPIFE